jgi:hypothetical protein
MEEHLPGEMLVAWTIEAMAEMGIGLPARAEDIPDEARFRVHQRILRHLADRATEPLATQLRETYRYNEEYGPWEG